MQEQESGPEFISERDIAWAKKAIDKIRLASGKQLPARDFFEVVERIHPWKHHRQWRRVTSVIKRVALYVLHVAVVPVRGIWMYGPSADHLYIWVKDTLLRIKPELTLLIDTMALPKYIRDSRLREFRVQIIQLRDHLQVLLDKMDEAEPTVEDPEDF